MRALILYTMVFMSHFAFANNSLLRVGDEAPEYNPANLQWLNGAAIPKLEKGHVYLFEFWSTWCPPCIASFPQLNEEAEKYRNQGFQVIAVAAREKGNSEAEKLATLTEFLKTEQGQLKFPVLFDPQGAVKTVWFDPTMSKGIPTSIVVDRDGRIVFIGHPVTLSEHIDAIIQGTWTSSTEYAQHRAENHKIAALTQKYEDIQKHVNDATAKKDWVGASGILKLGIISLLDKDFSRYAGDLFIQNLNILFHELKQYDNGYQLITALVNFHTDRLGGKPGIARFLVQILETIIAPDFDTPPHKLDGAFIQEKLLTPFLKEYESADAEMRSRFEAYFFQGPAIAYFVLGQRDEMTRWLELGLKADPQNQFAQDLKTYLEGHLPAANPKTTAAVRVICDGDSCTISGKDDCAQNIE